MQKTATNSAPKKCVCGRRLGKAEYGYPWINQSLQEKVGITTCDYKAPIKEKVWFVQCKCHNVIVWSFPNIWVVRNYDKLFDTREVLS